MGLFDYIKKLIQDAIEYNNTGEVAKGNTKAVVGGAVWDYIETAVQKHWKFVKNLTSTSGESVTIPSDAVYLLVVLFGVDNTSSYPYPTALCNSAEIPYTYLANYYDLELHGTYANVDRFVKYNRSSDKWLVSSSTTAAILYR